jgi:hypothetical protein
MYVTKRLWAAINAVAAADGEVGIARMFDALLVLER